MYRLHDKPVADAQGFRRPDHLTQADSVQTRGRRIPGSEKATLAVAKFRPTAR
jgi:hypothetical protein